MLSLRSFARAAPRSISRLTSQPQPRLLSRTAIFTPRIYQPSIARWSKPFSTTLARKEGNEELVAKLAAEYNIETEYRNDENVSNEIIKEYLETTVFEIQDTPGQEEVVLTRKYNDENIRITFSIADLASSEGLQNQVDPDRELYGDEEDDLSPQSGGANTKGSVNQGQTSGGNTRIAPEDSLSPADRPELDGEGPPEESSFEYPARVNVKITRDGQKGAMLIEATTSDGEFVIDNVCYFAEAAHADPETPAQDWKRRNIYAGPPFGNLDEDLQMLLENYLQDRAIDVKLARFVPEYIDFKEQKEYMRWLKNLREFLE